MLKIIVLAATVLGLAATIWLIGATGAAAVFAAIRRIGPIGFVALMAWTGINLGILGAAWFAVTPGLERRQLGTFAWARTTREAATDVLPFSQFGGLVVGARTASAGSIRAALVYASLVADQTTELAAQFMFSVFGIVVLLLVLGHAPVAANVVPLALGGLALMAAIMAAFAFAQRPVLKLAQGLAGHILPNSVTAMTAMRGELDAIYAARPRVVAAFLLHLAAWVFSAAGAWVALRFMGAAVPLWTVLAIESLIFTLRTVAFVVPGALGVQEGAYLLLAPVFGVDPQVIIALSLLKRARDLAIGVPALLWWQASEGRKLLA